jgi:hypothetical protein
MKRASGSFAVTIQPLPNTEVSSDPTLGRFLLVKKFTGDLVADARGQMLSAGTVAKGSGAYVAIDHFTGTLHGLTGSFVLHHTGILNQGVSTLAISVVPDSGTGELAGLEGKLTIRIDNQQHFYDFDYSLPNS